MRYEWIMFDADGTLFDFDKAAAFALEATFQQYGFSFEARYDLIYRNINQEVWAQYERGEIPAEELQSLRFSRLLETLGHTADPARMNNDYLDHLAEGSMLLDGAENLVKSLYGKVKMLLITNGFKRVQRPRLERSGLEPYFEAVVISDEVGVAKPDPAIFDHSFSQMGQPDRNKVLIIGDSLSSDIKGGQNYGIDTCWYNTNGRTRPDQMPITYQISSLEEIPKLL